MYKLENTLDRMKTLIEIREILRGIYIPDEKGHLNNQRRTAGREERVGDYMKFGKDEFYAACRQVSVQRLPEDIFMATCEIAYRQITLTNWTHGRPVAVFIRDGFPCIRYADGMWWHYDLAKERWFCNT